MVRSFFSAFLASGSTDLLAVTSKEKMLQLEPSSCSRVSAGQAMENQGTERTHSPCPIVKCPDGGVEVYLVAEGVGEGRALGNGGSNS